MIILVIYVAIFTAAFFVVRFGVRKFRQLNDFTSLKTVTFGDESAVRPDRWASVISVLTIFLIWGAFTGSKWVPVHAPGPFVGDTQFTYTLEAPDGRRDDATVFVRVFRVGETVSEPEAEPGDGFARNDVLAVGAWRSQLLLMDKNDEITREDGARVVAIDGQPVTEGQTVRVADGTVAVTTKGSLNFAPAKGMQMEPIWLPPPEAVVARVAEIANSGYQNFTLWEHLYWSLFRVIVGFALGALVGIPLGYAMGLSDWFRGWFDPIVEFMRPVPPLRQDHPAVSGSPLDHDHFGARGRLWRGHFQGARGLFAGCVEMAADAPCHRAQFPARDIYRRARRHGGLLGHGGRRRTGGRRKGRGHDDHGRLTLSTHRHCAHGDHPDRDHRLCHRHPDAQGRKLAGAVEGAHLTAPRRGGPGAA